jgi:sugar lactone lactonase YvrE
LQNSSGIGLNGIEIDPVNQAFLIAGQSGLPGKLWKIPFNGAAAGTPVEVKTNVEVRGIDGITFAANGNLFVVNNPEQIVYELRTTDDWDSAEVIAQGSSKFPTPTTLTFVNGAPYVVHAYFANITQYEIEKITLTPIIPGAAANVVFNFGLLILAFIAIIFA